LDNNKENIFIYLVNNEATVEFNNFYRENNGNVFDANGLLIDNYIVPENNKIFSWYRIKNNFEEIFLQYMILNGNGIQIGKYVSRIRTQKMEKYINISCFLDSDGNKIFKDFTSSNVDKNLAIVLDNKIIVFAKILKPLENSINFSIYY
jgi:preprotein translocase subunit SecD